MAIRSLFTLGRTFFRARKARRLVALRKHQRMLQAARKAKKGGLLRTAGVASVGGVGGNALQRITSALSSMGKDKDAESQRPAAQVLEFAQPNQEDQPQIERPRLVDLFDTVEVDRVNIVPKLGPRKGEYADHLNLIIKRVARLEERVATQNNLIGKLNAAVRQLHEQERRQGLEDQRDEAEEKVEKSDRSSKLSSLKDTIAMSAKATGAMAAKVGAALLLGGGALALLSSNAQAAGEEQPADPFEEWDSAYDGFDDDADLEEISYPDLARSVSEVMTPAITGAAGASIGSGYGAGRPQLKLETPKSTPPPAGGAAAIQSNNKASIFRRAINKFKDIARRMKNGLNKITTGVRNLLARLKFGGQVIGRIIGRVTVGVYAVFELIDMWTNNIDFFIKGEIDEETFHRNNKEQLNRVINNIGIPVLFGIAGAKLGILAFGVGAFGGFIAGIAAGVMADMAWSRFGGPEMINQWYDSMIVDQDGPLRGLFDKLVRAGELMAEGMDMAKAVGEVVWKYHPARFVIEGVTTGIDNIRDRRAEANRPTEVAGLPDVKVPADIEWATSQQRLHWNERYSRAVLMQQSELPRIHERGAQLEQELLDEIAAQSPSPWYAPEWADENQKRYWTGRHDMAQTLFENEDISVRRRGGIEISKLENEVRTAYERKFDETWPGKQPNRYDGPALAPASPASKSSLDGLRAPTRYNEETGVFESVEQPTPIVSTSATQRSPSPSLDGLRAPTRYNEETGVFESVEQPTPIVSTSATQRSPVPEYDNAGKWWQPEWASADQLTTWDRQYRLSQNLQRNSNHSISGRGQNMEMSLKSAIDMAHPGRETIAPAPGVYGLHNETRGALPSTATPNVVPVRSTKPGQAQPIIIPVSTPQRQKSGQLSSALGPPSVGESAAPTQRTNDRFIELDYVT